MLSVPQTECDDRLTLIVSYAKGYGCVYVLFLVFVLGTRVYLYPDAY